MILLDGKEIEWTKYPNGEVGLHSLDFTSEQLMRDHAPTVKWSWENDGELMRLYFLKRWLDDRWKSGQLQITYMPYSRMDRVPNGEAFTLKYVAEFINQMNWQSVAVCEPHSDVTMALLDRSHAFYPIEWLFPEQIAPAIEFDIDHDYLVFPDAGAEKRYGKMFPGYQSIVMSKTRDFKTGQITGLEISGKMPTIGPGLSTKALIIDDLCSRGGTFIGAIDELRNSAGIDRVFLYITHAEVAMLSGNLMDEDGPERIFTTDAFPTAKMPSGWPINKSKKITVYNV